jgi:cell division transport system permease protein
MRAWLRQHRQAMAAAFGKVAAQKAAAALNALVIGIALALPAGGYALLASLRSATAGAPLEAQLSVFMRVDARRQDADALAARLKGDPRLRELRFVPREQALKEAAGERRPRRGGRRARPQPPAGCLRAATEIRGSRGDRCACRRSARLARRGRVQADSAWARRLAALADTARMAIALLAALLAFGLVAITFNTIRLQILTQRAEIEISKLIGATDAFIRRPFFYLGALQGVTGGMLALAIVWGSLRALNLGVAELAASYGSGFRLAFLTPGDALAVVLFSAGLGWFGAYLSVSRYLLEIEPK